MVILIFSYDIGAKKICTIHATIIFVITVDASHSAHYYHNTCARGRSRRGTLSKMASFIVDSCRDQRFSLEMWDWRRTIAWGLCTPLTIVDQFGIKISGFTPSYEALGRLLKKKNITDFAYERFLV